MKKKYYPTYKAAEENSKDNDVILYHYPEGFYIIGQEKIK